MTNDNKHSGNRYKSQAGLYAVLMTSGNRCRWEWPALAGDRPIRGKCVYVWQNCRAGIKLAVCVRQVWARRKCMCVGSKWREVNRGAGTGRGHDTYMVVAGSYCWRDKSVCADKYRSWSVCGGHTKDRTMVLNSATWKSSWTQQESVIHRYEYKVFPQPHFSAVSSLNQVFLFLLIMPH